MVDRIMPWGILLLLLLAVATPLVVEAQDGGVLEGVVVNGTPGGPEIGAGVAVTLHVFEGNTELQALATTTDEAGRFRFEGLDIDPALEYWPEAVYLGVPTTSQESYRFDEGETEISATLTVYETTADDAQLRIGSVHLVAESFGQVLRVHEIHFVGNTGDRAYVGRAGEDGRSRTVFVPLPVGAMGVAFGDEVSSERFVQGEGGLWDTEPVPAGSETSLILFSYHLVVTGDTVPLERRFAYPVDSVNLMLVQPGLTVRGDVLQARGTQLLQERQYEVYAATDLGPDSPLVLEFVPLEGDGAMPMPPGAMGETAAAPASGGNQENLLKIGLALAVVAVGGVLGYWFGTRSRAPRRGPAADPVSDARARRLLGELADLEDAREAGRLEETDYEQQRAQLYESLKSS